MSNHHIKDFTKGKILPQLWSLSWPIMLTMFFHTLYNIVDTFWVSKISTDAIAAVGISQLTLMVMMSLSMGISVGSSVLMSMHIGAQRKAEAARVMAQSFIIATILGVIFTAISFLFKEQLLAVSGAVGSIYIPALKYFTITSAGAILAFYMINIVMLFNAEGDTFTLTKLFAVSTFINIVLDPLLIFGKAGLPALGIEGAAYATLISQAVFIALAMRVLSSPTRSIFFSWKNLSIQRESVKTVFNIGIPASLSQMLNPVGISLLIAIVSMKFLEPGATAFSLVFRLEFFAYLPVIGFSMGAMSMIGQNIGANNPTRANLIFKKTARLGFLSTTGIGVLLMIFGKFLIQIFTKDPVVVDYSLSYILIVAGTYGLMAVTMIVSSTFQAMGKSWPGFWIIFIKYFVIAIPASYLLLTKWNTDIWTVRASIAISNAIIALIGYKREQYTFYKKVMRPIEEQIIL